MQMPPKLSDSIIRYLDECVMEPVQLILIQVSDCVDIDAKDSSTSAIHNRVRVIVDSSIYTDGLHIVIHRFLKSKVAIARFRPVYCEIYGFVLRFLTHRVSPV